jgi:hypothetical protein
MDLTPKQQTSEAIRQAETVLILTGQRPSVDQVTAVIGLAAILRKFGKRVSPVISDNLPASVQVLETTGVERTLGGLRDFILKLDTRKAQVDSLRYEPVGEKLNIFVTPSRGGFAPSDVTFDYGQPSFAYDLAIVLGVPTRARLDRAYEQNLELFANIPMVNLDFHRSNEGYGAVNLIEPNASSLCEMLVALSESLQGGIIDAEIATTLLMGIVASTDRFTAAHTTSKSLTVAAQMMAAGARQQAVVKALYRSGGGGGGGDQPRNERQERETRGDKGGSDRERAESRERQTASAGSNERQRNARSEAAAHQPEAERTQAPEREPIIQPGHIEVSEVVHGRPAAEVPGQQPPLQQRTQSNTAPAQPTATQQMAPAPGPQTPAMPTIPAPERPPMADFAAAAEVLAQRQQHEFGFDNRGEGNDPENRPA